MHRWVCSFSILVVLPALSHSQDNYEIQIYGSETVAPRTTMVELHSNFTLRGSAAGTDGIVPSDRALHETLEVTRGITPWSEIGFYCFTYARSGQGFQWVGTHVRPRVRAPLEWGWPLGASISLEAGYQRRAFAAETWSLEIRPILDGQFGRLYISLNPAMDKSLSSPPGDPALGFSPGLKISYGIDSLISAGLEYYGSLGDFPQHMIIPSIDLNFSPDWEFNAGIGFGLTGNTDRLIVKLILGRRVSL